MSALVQIHPPFTSAEFYRMDAQGAFRGMRVELRRGMILKMAPQYHAHGHVQGQLIRALIDALRTAGLDWEVQTGTTIGFGGGFEPRPDMIVVDPTLISSGDGPLPPAAVRLVVEVSNSTLPDDLGEKREDYSRAGVPEYWVADVVAKTVIRHAEPDAATARFLREEPPVPLAEPIAMLTRPEVTAQA
jgi:Uma2 family endonuclease